MEIDFHAIKTKKSIDAVKKLLKKDVFGNYDVVDTKPGNAEFGIFLFQYNPNYIILKLDYTFYNYADVSRSIMVALGKILKTTYYIIGLKVESPEAFIRMYEYRQAVKDIVLIESLKEVDGVNLTPKVRKLWSIDLHDIWSKMQDVYNTEIARQRIQATGGSPVLKKAWIQKHGSLDNIDKRLCDTLYFIARKEIEKFRPDPKKVKITTVKLGRKVLPN